MCAQNVWRSTQAFAGVQLKSDSADQCEWLASRSPPIYYSSVGDVSVVAAGEQLSFSQFCSLRCANMKRLVDFQSNGPHFPEPYSYPASVVFCCCHLMLQKSSIDFRGFRVGLKNVPTMFQLWLDYDLAMNWFRKLCLNYDLTMIQLWTFHRELSPTMF